MAADHMTRTIKLSLGDQEYEIPHLTLGQAADLSPLLTRELATLAREQGIDADGKPADEAGKLAVITRYLEIAEIALRRAIPAIPDVREMDARSMS